MGCGRSSLNSNSSTLTSNAEKAAEKAAADKVVADKAAADKAAADAAAAQAVIDQAAAAQADSSYNTAVTSRNTILSSLPPIPPITAPSDTLQFGNFIIPSTAFPITIHYRSQAIYPGPVTTGTANITLYSMPNELLIQHNIVLFRYNATVNDHLIMLNSCNFDLYESDINPTDSDIYTLVGQGKARRVPLQMRIFGPVDTFYNITLNSGKYYQVIISSQGSPEYPTERQLIYYKSSVKRYMGVDGFTNKQLYNIEGYMENHPLLPKNYHSF